MSTVNGVHDISGLNIPLCQMVETGRREDQRPVNLAAWHTEMVCNSGLSVKWVARESRLDLWAKNPRGYGVSRNPLFLLVAGAGYVECYTAPETHWIDLK